MLGATEFENGRRGMEKNWKTRDLLIVCDPRLGQRRRLLLDSHRLDLPVLRLALSVLSGDEKWQRQVEDVGQNSLVRRVEYE
jgi:hypothetical protein